MPGTPEKNESDEASLKIGGFVAERNSAREEEEEDEVDGPNIDPKLKSVPLAELSVTVETGDGPKIEPGLNETEG